MFQGPETKVKQRKTVNSGKLFLRDELTKHMQLQN